MKSSDPERKVASIAPFGLRMQPELKQQIEEQARANGRSLNAEIVWRLEHSLSKAKDAPGWITAAKRQSLKTVDDASQLQAVEEKVNDLGKKVQLLLEERQERLGKT